eukprot:1236723-Karenia_brevis.AAC.1
MGLEQTQSWIDGHDKEHSAGWATLIDPRPNGPHQKCEGPDLDPSINPNIQALQHLEEASGHPQSCEDPPQKIPRT